MTQDPPRFFKLKGQIVPPTESTHHLLIAVTDVDPFRNDLIAVGSPDLSGSFCLTFARESFNQDLFENEATPDILNVQIYAKQSGDWCLLKEQRFDNPRFENEVEDLGEITINQPNATQDSTAIEVPGQLTEFGAWQRLVVDKEAVDRALSDALPIVEALTGWQNLLDGVVIKPVPNAYDAFSEIYSKRSQTQQTTSWLNNLGLNVMRGMGNGFAAVYDPIDKVVLVDEFLLGTAGYEALVVTLGHELVHVGQFREHPEMIGVYKDVLTTIEKSFAQTSPQQQSLPQELHSPLIYALSYMMTVEGFAQHIEDDHLRKQFRFGLPIPHMSPLVLALGLPIGLIGLAGLALWSLFSNPTDNEKNQDENKQNDSPAENNAPADIVFKQGPLLMKQAQYGWGREYYRAKAKQNPTPLFGGLADVTHIETFLPDMIRKFYVQ